MGTRAKSVSMASSVLFNIEEDQDSIPGEFSASAINRTVRTLSSPPLVVMHPTLKTFKSKQTPARPGAVSNATTVQSNDDLSDPGDADDRSDHHGDGDSSAFAFQRQRKRARSRKPSIYATWSCCGYALSNAVLRLITSLLTVPPIIAGLMLAPRLAVAFFTATLVCIGVFEFSWLSFRIHHQLLSTYNYYESKAKDTSTSDSDADNVEPEVETNPFQRSYVTQSTSSFSTGNFSLYAQNERDSFEDPVFDSENVSRAAAASSAYQSTPLDILFRDGAPDILSSIANSWFCGRVLVARITVAVVLAVVWSLASHYFHKYASFPVANVPQAFVDFPYFFWAVNLLASICALSTPSVKAALALVLQKEVFMVLMLNTVNCPLSSSVCEFSVDRPLLQPMQTFVIGLMLLLVFRSFTATNPADLAVSFMLDGLGYVYIVGTMGLLTALVDTSDAAGKMFVNVLLLLLGVVWAAELAGYACDALMYHFRIHHAQVFPKWLALKFDIEAAICSVGVAVAAMLVGSEVLDVPGSPVAKVFCALLAALCGRLGRLFLSLLKKAAGVRWASRLLPGYGGLLDAVSMLLFSSLVFAQYFVYVGTLMIA
ncbi:Transmembrane protein, partial [Globisporangium polare]